MTPEERHLWYDFLRTYPVRFLRQKVAGGYILDFYCASVKLAVEVDGTQHYTPDQIQYDAERERYLDGWVITVVRVPNSDIRTTFSEVCTKIGQIVQTRMQSINRK